MFDSSVTSIYSFNFNVKYLFIIRFFLQFADFYLHVFQRSKDIVPHTLLFTCNYFVICFSITVSQSNAMLN